jgi:hypothetical protein
VVSPKGEVAVINDWMTITPEVIAQQITLYEWEIFQEIQPSEFYSNAWQKRDKELLSPHLTQLARFFNNLSFWIATEIIRANANNRLKVLKHVLLMADVSSFLLVLLLLRRWELCNSHLSPSLLETS